MKNASLTRRQLLGFGAVIGASACMPRILRDSSKGADFDWTLSTAESAGFTPTGLIGLRSVIQQAIESHQITGAVTAIARNNRLAYYEAQGLRDPAVGTPMRTDDLFRMMSSTKPVTAVAVLAALEEGNLSLDDKLSRFIPAFSDIKVAIGPAEATDKSQVQLVPAQREITLKDLLTHTSGLSSWVAPMSMGPAGLVKKVERQADDTLDSYISRLAPAILDFQPGSRWGYSPLDGFDVLLRVVEIVSGQRADVFLRERIFEPLDMRDTWFHVPASEQARILPLYGRDGEAWSRQKPLLDDLPPNYFSGAGGLYSTAHDFLQFELMLLNNGALNGRRILRPESVALMATNQIGTLFADSIPPLTNGLGFGLGVRIVVDTAGVPGRSIGAFGWGGAYGTETWADPQLGIAAAVLVQQPVRPLTVSIQAALRAAVSPI
jgi:CubicO group peptidase (beta-lactamase class C family)